MICAPRVHVCNLSASLPLNFQLFLKSKEEHCHEDLVSTGKLSETQVVQQMLAKSGISNEQMYIKGNLPERRLHPVDADARKA